MSMDELPLTVIHAFYLSNEAVILGIVVGVNVGDAIVKQVHTFFLVFRPSYSRYNISY